MKIVISTLFLIVGFYSFKSHAKDSLTLLQALSEGEKNNPQLKIASALLKESQWKKREVFGAYLPKVDLVFNHFFDLKYQQIQTSRTTVFNSTYPVTSYGAQVSLNIFDGFKTTYSNSSANANVEAAELELLHTKMASENSIRLKYFQALGAQVLKEVAEVNVKTLSDHLKRAKELLKEGELTKADLLKIQVQLEQAIPEKFEAADHAYLTRKNLSEAMGIEDDERPLEEKLPVPSEQVIKRFNDNRASSKALSSGRLDLQALQKRLQSSQDLYKASTSGWMPRVNFTGDYLNYNNQNFSISDSKNFKNAYSFGVNLMWNIFEGGSGFARQEQSYYQKVQLEHKAQKMILSSANEVEFWKRRYLNSSVLYSAKLRSVEASKESVRIYQNGLKAGTRTNSDLLDAELDLDRSEAGVVKAQLDAIEALLNLELAIGRRL